MAIFRIGAAIRAASVRKVKYVSPLVTGFVTSIAKLIGFGKFVDEVYEQAAEEVAKDILDDAISRVPLETGNLRNSAFIHKSGSGANATFSFGFDAEYAAYVHAQVEMRLKGVKRKGAGRTGLHWDPQGQAEAEFLKKAFEANSSKLKDRIINTLS